jgi:hypothetical protein
MSDRHEEYLAVTLFGTREIDWNINISIYFTQEAQQALVAADRMVDTAVVEVMRMVPL